MCECVSECVCVCVRVYVRPLVCVCVCNTQFHKLHFKNSNFHTQNNYPCIPNFTGALGKILRFATAPRRAGLQPPTYTAIYLTMQLTAASQTTLTSGYPASHLEKEKNSGLCFIHFPSETSTDTSQLVHFI